MQYAGVFRGAMVSPLPSRQLGQREVKMKRVVQQEGNPMACSNSILSSRTSRKQNVIARGTYEIPSQPNQSH